MALLPIYGLRLGINFKNWTTQKDCNIQLERLIDALRRT